MAVEQGSWYQDNDFTAGSVLASVQELFTNWGASLTVKDRDPRSGSVTKGGRRFYGALPGMFEARGIEILEDPGLSIMEMVREGLLHEDILNKLKGFYSTETIIDQGVESGEVAYCPKLPIVPGSLGLTLERQQALVKDHCSAVMEGALGISPGVHNLRDNLAFATAYHRATGRYPMEDGGAARTQDLLKVDGQDQYHPTVWVYRIGQVRKLVVELMKADTQEMGTGVLYFWKPV